MPMQRASDMLMSMCDHGMIYTYILGYFARTSTHMHMKKIRGTKFFMRGVGRLLRDNFQQTEAKATLETALMKV